MSLFRFTCYAYVVTGLKGWGFQVGTWNIDSLTGRASELVEALAERKMDVACVQEARWRGSGCRLFGAVANAHPFQSFFMSVRGQFSPWTVRYSVGTLAE